MFTYQGLTSRRPWGAMGLVYGSGIFWQGVYLKVGRSLLHGVDFPVHHSVSCDTPGPATAAAQERIILVYGYQVICRMQTSCPVRLIPLFFTHPRHGKVGEASVLVATKVEVVSAKAQYRISCITRLSPRLPSPRRRRNIPTKLHRHLLLSLSLSLSLYHKSRPETISR